MWKKLIVELTTRKLPESIESWLTFKPKVEIVFYANSQLWILKQKNKIKFWLMTKRVYNNF